MSRWMLLLALLAGCEGAPGTRPDEVGGTTNGLQVRLEVEVPEPCEETADTDEEPDGDCFELSYLAVRIGEVVLWGEGPDGEVSVSNSTPAHLPLVGGGAADPLPVVELATGTWRDVDLEVQLRPGDAPAVAAEGTLGSVDWRLRVDEVVVVADSISSFRLGEGPDAEVVVTLDPEAWFDPVDPEDLELDGELGPGDSRYDLVVERIASTAEVRFPGEGDR